MAITHGIFAQFCTGKNIPSASFTAFLKSSTISVRLMF